MTDDPNWERLRREEHGDRVRDLTERFGVDIDEGGYSAYEATLALVLSAATLCLNDRHFCRLVGVFAEAWERIVSDRDSRQETSDLLGTRHPPPRRLRLVLDESAFRDLVRGRPVHCQAAPDLTVELILEDIGWQRMIIALDDAARACGAAIDWAAVLRLHYPQRPED